MKSKEYKLFKNFLHNELGISKDEIRQIVREVVRDEAKSIVQSHFQRNDTQVNKLLDNDIKNQAKAILNGSSYISRGTDELWKSIGKEIISQLKIDLKND